MKMLRDRADGLAGQTRLCPMLEPPSLASLEDENTVNEDFPIPLLPSGKVGQSRWRWLDLARSLDQQAPRRLLPAEEHSDISLMQYVASFGPGISEMNKINTDEIRLPRRVDDPVMRLPSTPALRKHDHIKIVVRLIRPPRGGASGQQNRQNVRPPVDLKHQSPDDRVHATVSKHPTRIREQKYYSPESGLEGLSPKCHPAF